ncbi:DUF5134 domain-containing protein [Streptomyces sp. NPDC002514]|uniref:DUF5134 domain-containing protein n=1 Tax=Streptomyces sp. NPDC001270 TaxID=3364554 RepID=UPI003699E1F3
MAWPWGMNLSTAPQVVLFSAGALWFLAAAPFRSGDRARHRAALAACPHALMMGAMAWMAAAMDFSGAMAGHSGSGGGMPGTDMSGGTGIAAMSLTGNGPRTAAGLLAVALAVIGPAWPARAFDRARAAFDRARARPPPAGPAGGSGPAGADTVGVPAPACHAAMALGRAVMFALLG